MIFAAMTPPAGRAKGAERLESAASHSFSSSDRPSVRWSALNLPVAIRTREVHAPRVEVHCVVIGVHHEAGDLRRACRRRDRAGCGVVGVVPQHFDRDARSVGCWIGALLVHGDLRLADHDKRLVRGLGLEVADLQVAMGPDLHHAYAHIIERTNGTGVARIGRAAAAGMRPDAKQKRSRGARTRTPTACCATTSPKGTDFKPITQARLDAVAAELTGRPRQTLGWVPPSTKFAEAVALTH